MGIGTLLLFTFLGLVAGATAVWLITRTLLKQRTEGILAEARREAEVIKQKKLLEVKEKFLQLKGDLEKQVAQRNSKLQSVESKLKSREQTLNQRQEDITKKGQEMDLMRENLTAQLSVIEKKKTELDELKTREQAHLESLSGLSAAEAKDRLVESLKDEAKG